MFASKARAYPSEAPFLALPTNNRLLRKGLLGTNTLAIVAPNAFNNNLLMKGSGFTPVVLKID